MPQQEVIETATLTVDLVLMACEHGISHVLLIQGKYGWCLPGGKVRQGETLTDALCREACEEIGIYPGGGLPSLHFAEPIGYFADPKRDARGRYVSFPFRVLIQERSDISPVAGSDASSWAWFSLSKLPTLAYDHKDIIEHATKLQSQRMLDLLTIGTPPFPESVSFDDTDLP